MAAKVSSKRLVIDASVTRSSGGSEAIHPTSVNCRNFLLAVLEICHRVVMTPGIRQEWDNHQSRFAREWLRRMVAKKKLVALPDLPVDVELWSKVEALAESDGQWAQMAKDMRLIEAAIATDKTIVSLDENTARKLFGKAATQIQAMQSIIWVNPDKPEEQCLDWLQKGALPEKQRTFGAYFND